MEKTIILFFLISSSLFLPLEMASNSTVDLNEEESSVNAVMTTNKTEIKVNETFKLSVTISNSWCWNLYNISYNITIPTQTYFHLISGKNTSKIGYEDIVAEGEENINVNISKIEMNNTASFYFTGRFHREDEYTINDLQIGFKKKRGTLEGGEDSINCEGITFTVKEAKEEANLPSEGTRDLEAYIILALIMLPILLLTTLTYIARP